MREPERILIFRFSSLGDVALSVPVIVSALQQNPHVHIDYVTPKFMHDLFPRHDRLRLINFDKHHEHKGILGLIRLYNSLSSERYAGVADLHDVIRTKFLLKLISSKTNKTARINKDRKGRKALMNGKIDTPLKHTTEKYADVLRQLNLNVNLDHILKNILFEASAKLPHTIGVAPFARHAGKMYPLEKMFEAVKILSKNYEIIIYGSQAELNIIKDWGNLPHVNLSEGTSLRQELMEISNLPLLISMDSANMHLASLVGTKVVSLWGVTHPYAGFLGYGQSIENVIQDETCTWRPSSIYGNKLGPKSNPTGFKNISVDQIIEKVNENFHAL